LEGAARLAMNHGLVRAKLHGVGGRRSVRRVLGGMALMCVLLGSACGGSGDDTTSEEADSADSADDSSTPLPPEATPGFDDYNDDGEPEPTCGTQDFGAGLVLRKPCQVTNPHEPPHGVTLVEGSLFAYNSPIDIDVTGISGDLLQARDEAGIKTMIVTFNSDNLFDVNSSALRSSESMNNTVKLINRLWPNSTLQVRGHTDGTGGASASQKLSDARALSAKTYLEEHGIKAREITAVGLGATQPFAKEDNDAARMFNRRVEIVVRVS
jgi:outer membrane protein OmpA-like peptidoglycan-associated protein